MNSQRYKTITLDHPLMNIKFTPKTGSGETRMLALLPKIRMALEHHFQHPVEFLAPDTPFRDLPSGDRVFWMRQRKGLSQRDLAARARITQGRISAIEARKVPLSAKAAHRLAEALECHHLDLL